MKFDFSAHFLRINPPDTSFADAWESLCYSLLQAELSDTSLIRFRPPDKGIDILHRKGNRAYQCKSDERGALGSIAATESIKSLKSASAEKAVFDWEFFAFATNANYTGSAFASITTEGTQLGLQRNKIEFLGPEYWERLCVNHPDAIEGRFDYRIPVPKPRVIQVIEQRYYPQYASQFATAVAGSELVLRVSNNRTPAVLEVPFSPELTIKHLVNVSKDLLGVSLDWTNYPDLGTSSGPSVSLTLDGKKQTFDTKISDLNLPQDGELQFWITLVWRDERQKDAGDAGDIALYHYLSRRAEFVLADRESLTYNERRDRTIARSEEIIETMLWAGVQKLKTG